MRQECQEEAFIFSESQGANQGRYLSSKILEFVSNQISDSVAFTMLIHNNRDFEDKGPITSCATLSLIEEEKTQDSLKLINTSAQQLNLGRMNSRPPS